MRLVVFFDLPVETVKNRKDYRLFRKFLISNGYMMMQESVYSKLVTNEATADSALLLLSKNRPPKGLVQVLKVTEKQYATMVYITGTKTNQEIVDSMDGLVVL